MAAADRWRHALILTVTRRCNLRCAYCPTVKEGLPDLSPDDTRRAIDLFVERYGGGDCKIFGGEPMLAPESVAAAIRHAPPSVSVYLSTNGLFLTPELFDLLRAHPSVTLTLSLDGQAQDHDGLRRVPGARGNSHAAILEALPELLRLPRFVVSQTIAPATAVRAAENFAYLLSLGIKRFNLLPGYYLPWRAEQLQALQQNFAQIAAQIEGEWAQGRYLYLRNLFIRAPHPFYNSGMVVDCDRRIYASNLILSGSYDDLRDGIAQGDLDHPPTMAELEVAAQQTAAQLRSRLSPTVLSSTEAVDSLLTHLCMRLYPAYFKFRSQRQPDVHRGL